MKRVVEGAFAFLFLAAVGYFSFHWAMEGLIHSKPERQIPDLRGRSVLAALDMLAPLKLGIRKEDEEFNDQVPIGAILRQYPEAGTIVREGKTVRVVIGQGGESVFVPSLIGLPLRNAEMLLRQRQLLLGEVSESFSLRVEKGFVLSQDPGAESSIEKNTMVNAVVSAGSPPPGIVLFPDFRQRNVGEAETWAQKHMLPVAITANSDSLFPRGTILSQKPNPDAIALQDSVLSLEVSRGGGDVVASASKRLQYQVSQGSSESLVRIVVINEQGEREVFNGLRSPGSKIDLAIPDAGNSRARIFVNGILVEERDL